MNRVVPVLALVLAVALPGAGVARAQPSSQITYEMVIEGLPARAKAKLTIESWSWGASADNDEPEAAASAKGRKRDVSVQDLHFVVEQDPVATMLLETMMARKPLPKVTLRSLQAAPDRGFELVLSDVRISSYQTGGSGHGSGPPMEQISMTFRSAKLTVAGKAGKHSAVVANP